MMANALYMCFITIVAFIAVGIDVELELDASLIAYVASPILTTSAFASWSVLVGRQLPTSLP